MSSGTLLLGLGLAVFVAALAVLVILWAREESAKAVEAPFYQRAAPGPYHVQLVETGRRKSAVLRLVRRASPVSLADAYAMVQRPPAIVAQGVSREDAEWLQERLEEKGAQVRIYTADAE